MLRTSRILFQPLSENQNVLCYLCLSFQMLILSSKGEIIFEEENCLDVSKSYPGAPVEILKCHGMGGNQQWEHDKKSVSMVICRNVLVTI